jgi:hypothetical protein
MPVDLQKFTQLYARLCRVDFTGTVSGVRPSLSTAANIKSAIAKGSPLLPLVYRQQFAAPLTDGLPSLLAALQQAVGAGQISPQDRLGRIESFYAPIYEHGANIASVDVRPELARFLAVVSNLFRSFVNSNKRKSVGVPLVTDTPPLAFFQTDAGQGPYTITSETMQGAFGTPVGIVSLPATYRADPILWASLTHEVCGHDVVHADDKLVPELVADVRALFTQSFNPHQNLNPATLSALLWSYWIDEAVADAYGVLNMGPTFPLNLAGFFAALRATFANKLFNEPIPASPQLSTSAGPRDPRNGDNGMDEHPIDVLRLHLAIGVIDSMPNLTAAKRAGYIADIEAVANLTADGATEVQVKGLVEISHTDFIPVDTSIPLVDAAKAARAVGKLIATKRLAALNGHSIQDVETWDDADEMAAVGVAGKIANGQSIVSSGDDAQLLAGATMAVLGDPGRYDQATSLLNDALDDSFRNDPIWGDIQADHMFAPSAFYGPEKVRAAGGGRAQRRRK